MAAGNRFSLKQASVRMVEAPPLYSAEQITTPEAAVRLLAKELKDHDRESVCVVNLQNDLKPINFCIASVGTLDRALLHPRELMKCMFLSNAANVIIVHNHPSGSLTPSKEDIRITDRMSSLCRMAGIPLIDHIIIGGGSDRLLFSFSEKGMIRTDEISYADTIEELSIKPERKRADLAEESRDRKTKEYKRKRRGEER